MRRSNILRGTFGDKYSKVIKKEVFINMQSNVETKQKVIICKMGVLQPIVNTFSFTFSFPLLPEGNLRKQGNGMCSRKSKCTVKQVGNIFGC